MITTFPRLGVPSTAGVSLITWDSYGAWGYIPPPATGARQGVQYTIGPTGITWDIQAAYGSSGGAPPTWNLIRRSTALHLLLNTLPAGDGSISRAELQDVTHCYAGILVGALAAFPRRTVNMMLLLNTLSPGDGTIDQADRQNTTWHYGGILAGAPPTTMLGYIPEDHYDKSTL